MMSNPVLMLMPLRQSCKQLPPHKVPNINAMRTQTNETQMGFYRALQAVTKYFALCTDRQVRPDKVLQSPASCPQ